MLVIISATRLFPNPNPNRPLNDVCFPAEMTISIAYLIVSKKMNTANRKK